MNKKNLMIMLSVVPGLPILFFGCTLAITGVERGGMFWSSMTAATMLGIIGSLGLVLASFPFSHTSKNRRVTTGAFVLCGYLAIIIAIAGLYFSHVEQQAMVPPGWHGNQFPTAQLAILLFLLSWPMTAGGLAIHSLSKNFTPHEV